MRLWNLAGSLAVVALALTAWRYADLTAMEECPPADSTCVGIAELFYRTVAASLLALAVAVLFLRKRHFEPSESPKARFPFEGARVGDKPDVLFD
jgi:hypothetical protein